MPQRHYTQIKENTRAQIEGFLKLDLSQTEIAELVGCSQSAISRELRRNSTPNLNNTTRVNEPVFLFLDGRNFRGTVLVDEIRTRKERYNQRLNSFKQKSPHYAARTAQRFRDERMSSSAKKRCLPILERKENEELLKCVRGCLRLRWSPEQIALRLFILNIFCLYCGLPPLIKTVSHRAIYTYIHNHPEEDLIKYLRRKGKKYHYEKATIYNQTNRNKHSIHDRPRAADALTEAGHNEGDTIVGKDKKDRLLTHVDRMTGVGSISLILGFDAEKVRKASVRDVRRIFDNDTKTITYDNGIEFSNWQKLEKDLGVSIYFADPYKSCQRGRNENFNGLVRDFYPKGTDFKKISKSDIMRVESLLNNRPRKRFFGLTPLEMRELVMLCG